MHPPPPESSDTVVPVVAARRADELHTFLTLLGDESALVQRGVRRELERRGRAAWPLLRQIERRGGSRARAAARRMLLSARRERVVRRLIAYASSKEIDLERGLMLLSRFEEPGLDLRPYMLAIDAMAAEVGKRVDARGKLDGQAKILCDYLGRELGYRGDERDYHLPDNVFLHRTIVRKRGLPLTLVALYLFVARRAGIRAAPVALPGHVVLRIYDGDERGQLVDPFDGGAPLSERECLSYLAEFGLPFQPRWFDDSDDASVWVRHVHNLANAYRRRGLEREVRLLRPLISSLERHKNRAAQRPTP